MRYNYIMIKVIDTHSHVLSSSYGDELNDVIKKMKQENIEAFNISFDIKSSKEVLKLNKDHSFLHPVIGIHPVDSKNIKQESIDELRKLISDNDVAAIGEIGLDYYHEGYDKDVQKKWFIKQIELAGEFDLPVVIHTRDSLDDCYEIIKNYPNQKFLLHSWSGDKELTKKVLNISDNIYFSYNGIITFKNAPLQKEVIKEIPIDRIMFETDCPYLTPTPFRGKTNYPWYTKNIIEFVSELLNINFEKLNEINNKNSYDFYNIKN